MSWVTIKISKKTMEKIAEVKGNHKGLDGYCEKVLLAFAKREKREIIRLLKEIRGEK